MKCSSCGADMAPGSPTCEYCGSSAMSPKAAPAADLFEQIERSPQYEQRNSPERHAALPTYSGLAKAAPIAFFVVFIVAGLSMAAMAAIMAGEVGSPIPLLMGLVPLSFAVLGVFLIIQFSKKHHAFDQAAIVARAAVVVGKRTAVSGGSGDSSATTAYYLTAEFEEGARAEFQTMTPDLYGRVAERDAGVLFTRASLALDFDRVSP